MLATWQGHGKRRLLEKNDILVDSVGAVKLFARHTELMSATLARAEAIFCSRNLKKAQKITEYHDTAPLKRSPQRRPSHYRSISNDRI